MAKWNELRTLATKLYDAGFNVVPVDSSKRPLTSWSAGKRIAKSELIEKLEDATGIAIVGGLENPSKKINYALLIVDVDDPDVLEKIPLLKELIGQTVSWKTGPRCPKCGNKHLEIVELGKRFKCPKCGAEFSVTEAKRGLGALFWLPPESQSYFKGTIRTKEIEFLVNNYQLIPPSLHPSGVRYEWIKEIDFNAPGFGIYALAEAEAKAIIDALKELKGEEGEGAGGDNEKASGANDGAKAETKLRTLTDDEVIRIKNLLKDAYVPGVRQNLVLYLSGWLAKAKIHPLNAVQIVKMLYQETNDEDSLKMRLSAVVYSYKKAGIDVDKWGDEIEKLTGVRPYGLEKQIREGEVKGKAGLQEILVEVFREKLRNEELAEQRALAIINEIEEILGVPSPFRDSIIRVIDRKKKTYAVADLRRMIMAIAEKEDDRLVYRIDIASVAPTKVVIYDSPIDPVRKYEITFEGKKRLKVGPALLEEIADRLRIEGLTFDPEEAYKVLARLVDKFIDVGMAEIRTEVDRPGFYIINGKLVVVNYEYNNMDKDKLRQALELLNELADVWFKRVQDKFALVVKWGAIAPFNYAMKQKGKFLKWLYLYGDSATGKTTLGRIVLKLWGLEPRFEKTGASIDTVPRLGQVLSQGTFPVLVNEPGGALNKEELVDTIKNAVDNLIARSKYIKGSYVDIPALAPLVFASNRTLPKDDALLRRLYVVTFSFSEKIPLEKQREFREKIEPKLNLLSEIGKCIAKIMADNLKYLDLEPLEAGKELLAECYKEVGLQAPEWLSLTYESSSESVYDEIIDSIRGFLIKRINEEYSRFVGRVTVEIPKKDGEEGEVVYDYKTRDEVEFEDRALTVLRKKLLPWAILRDDTVIITSDFVKELGGETGTLEGLKSIAELLGWEYTNVKINGSVRKCARVKLDDFLRFLNPEVE